MAQNDVEKYAYEFTRRGYSVYPVIIETDDDGNKIPLFKTTEGEGGRVLGWKNGHYPTEPSEIRRHWEGYDSLAINTGRSRVVCVDIDTGKGRDGNLALRAAGINLPDTPLVVRTQSGGEHRYYRMGSIDVYSSQSLLAPGVDIRAIGGVAFAPPSVVRGTGAAYSFMPGAQVVPVGELPEFPAYLAAQLQSQAPPSRSQKPPSRPLTTSERAFHERRINKALRAISQLQDGRRHAGLLKHAPIVFGSALLLDSNVDEYIEKIEQAYHESGGVDWRNEKRTVLDSLEYAREHPFELADPPSSDDVTFEEEVNQEVRRRLIKAAADERLSPIKTRSLTDEDILTFDPSLGDGDWWIPNILPRGETVIVFGKPAAGKSFAALDLAMGIATGTRAWGFDVPRGRAMYLAGEGTRRLPARQRAWIGYHGTQPEGGWVELRRMSLALSSDRSVREHAEYIAHREIDLVIVDTLIRAAEELSLENTTEAGRVVAQIDQLRALRPGCTVVVLHHPPESDPDKPGGAYPIRGNVDTIIQLSSNGGIRTLRTIKSKEGDEWSSNFELRDAPIPGGRSAVFVPLHSGVHDPFEGSVISEQAERMMMEERMYGV